LAYWDKWSGIASGDVSLEDSFRRSTGRALPCPNSADLSLPAQIDFQSGGAKDEVSPAATCHEIVLADI
jgi:hypothetical protein